MFLRFLVGETTLSTATGFIAGSPIGPILITCRHCFTGRDNLTNQPLSPTAGVPDRVTIYHNGAEKKNGVDTIIEVTQPLLEDNRPLWLEHPRLGPRADIAALPLRTDPKLCIREIDISEQDKISLRPTEMVSIVGFPFGKRGPAQFAIWAAGFIASEYGILYDGLPQVLIDSRSRPGQSGSPVLAYRTGLVNYENGEVAHVSSGAVYRFVGVYSGRIHRESDIGTVWRADAVRELVASVPGVSSNKHLQPTAASGACGPSGR